MKFRSLGFISLMIASLVLSGCKGGVTNGVPTPTPSPTIPPCIPVGGQAATAASFPAVQASSNTVIIPAVDNIATTMTNGALTIAPATTNLLTAVSDFACGGAPLIPGATTVYEYMAFSAGGGSVTFPLAPALSFTFPAGVSLVGKTFSLSILTPALTWNTIGTGTVSGQAVSFATGPPGSGFTLNAGALMGQYLGFSSP